MIKYKAPRRVIFTGKDRTQFLAAAEGLGLSPQELLTGCLWEHIMRKAREGMFLAVGRRNALRSKKEI